MVKSAIKLSLGLFLILLLIMPIEAGDDSEDSYAEQLLKAAKSYDAANGDRDRAVELYRRYLKEWPNDPKNIEVEFRIAQLLSCVLDWNKGDRPRFDEAIEVYKRIIKKYPRSELKYVQAMICLGDIYQITRQFDKAQEQYARILGVDQNRIKIPAYYELSPSESKELILNNFKSKAVRVKEIAIERLVDMATYFGTNVEKVVRLYQLKEKYPDPKLAELVERKIDSFSKHDRRNVSEIAMIEKQILAEIAREKNISLDEQYLAEIDRLEREIFPSQTRKAVRKEILITTEEAIAAMEEEVLEGSERAAEGAIKSAR
jgi:tetratricopeptide (TPR) repeat protein